PSSVLLQTLRMLRTNFLNLPPTLFRLTCTANTQIYTLSLHDALPISFHYGKHHKAYVDNLNKLVEGKRFASMKLEEVILQSSKEDRKSTRLNSSHVAISYAVFCLKKKKQPMSDVPGWRRSIAHPGSRR